MRCATDYRVRSEVGSRARFEKRWRPAPPPSARTPARAPIASARLAKRPKTDGPAPETDAALAPAARSCCSAAAVAGQRLQAARANAERTASKSIRPVAIAAA